jgi:MFS family permease
MIGMIFATSMDQMMILCMILGAGNGMYLTAETSLAVDALPHSRNKEEEGLSVSGGNAQLLGIWGVAAFLGTTLGPMIGGPLLFFFGSNPEKLDEGQDYSIEGYSLILGLSAIYFLFSALALQWINKI